VLRLMGFPPTVFELPGGSCSDWPPILPQDSKACYLANVALGMKGSNIYIFTGGPNLPGTGTTSDIYDFNAPIGPRGEVRPLYHEVKAVGLYLKANPWLVEAERVGDCRLALDFDLARSDKYWKSRGKFLFTGNDGWEFQRKGILTSAFCAGLSPMCCDLRADDWINDRSTPLMVVDTSSMARAKQERLVRYLKGGGKLLIAPVLPEVDEHMEPCTILADFLGRPKLSQLPEHTFVRLTIGGVVNVNNSGEVFVGESISPQAQAVGLDEASGKEMAWTIPTQGGGTVLLLGFRWQHALNQHGEMLASLMGMLGWKQKVKCSNPNVWTSLRTDGKRAVLFLMNLFSSPLDAEVRCWSPLSQTMIDLGHHALGAMTVKAVELKAAQRPAPAKTKAKAKAKTRAK
jgi:beta-galactosidase